VPNVRWKTDTNAQIGEHGRRRLVFDQNALIQQP
jgi:hypothetical protein